MSDRETGNGPEFAYKVVAVIEGRRREYRARDRTNALNIWHELDTGSRNGNGVERVWCERAPLGGWEVFTSELGSDFRNGVERVS